MPHFEWGILERYSYRKASIGSSLAALTAGHSPKISPIEQDTKKPKSTAHIGIIDGRVGARRCNPRLTTHPTKIPIMPPTAVSVIASVKNCQMMSDFLAPSAGKFCHRKKSLSRSRRIAPSSNSCATDEIWEALI